MAMRTVWNVCTTLDTFPERLRQSRPTGPTKDDLVHAVQHMLDQVVRERRAVIDTNLLVAGFNTLLQQAKEQFRDADTLRLIEPLGGDASVALLAVRLSLVKRALRADLARAAVAGS